MNRKLEDIFRKGSKTYFTSSLFFPSAVREDVIKLYAFVRTADDFVDNIPADPESFLLFANRYREGLISGPTGDVIIDSFLDLSRRYCFKKEWTEAFLQSMESDLHKRTYESMEDLLGYVYGSAEVIGLFMARILGLPEKAEPFARMQGRAMQLINFIRDVEEDNRLSREYLPTAERRPYLLTSAIADEFSSDFCQYIRRQISLYKIWQEEAEEGYRYIPKRYLIAIKTAADMYKWTASVIENDPFVVFRKKVKPAKGLILMQVMINAVSIGLGGKSDVE